jgi:hypothetical protein
MSKYAPGGILAERDDNDSAPNNIEVNPNRLGKRDGFLGDLVKEKDPVVITIIVLFVIICVLLGLCMVAGWWCNVDKPKHFNFTDAFKSKFSRSALSTPIKPVTASVPSAPAPAPSAPVTGRGEDYTSELSF